MRFRRFPALLLALATACGGDSSTAPGKSFENIGGSYSGTTVGLSQGVALNSVFTLTITQNAGTLGGSYAINGTLRDASNSVDVQGTGTVTGTIESGTNPSVNITVRPGQCPTRTATFSGTYDSANRRINLVGPVQFFLQDCTVFLTYQMNLLLTR